VEARLPLKIPRLETTVPVRPRPRAPKINNLACFFFFTLFFLGTFLVTASSEVETVNGKPYGNQYAILCQVRDGVVLKWGEYNDPAPITAAFSDFF
jgi:hypothetical protein